MMMLSFILHYNSHITKKKLNDYRLCQSLRILICEKDYDADDNDCNVLMI